MSEIAREDDLVLHDKKPEQPEQPQGTKIQMPGGVEGYKR